jgi:hypothetical protein
MLGRSLRNSWYSLTLRFLPLGCVLALPHLVKVVVVVVAVMLVVVMVVLVVAL